MWQKSRAGMRVCPCLPPLGCKQRLLGHPGALAQGSLPRPGDPCVQRQVRAAGYPQPGTGPAALGPALALLQGTERGSRSTARGAAGGPRGQWGRGGRSQSSGHEDAWSDGAHPGTETLMRGRGPAGPRHGRASGGDGGRGRGAPAPRVPLYTVGGARRPLLPVLKYCSLTDMALTMGPEMRGGGSPPTPRCRSTPGSPGGPPCPTTGDGGAAGRAPGFVLWAWPRAGGGRGMAVLGTGAGQQRPTGVPWEKRRGRAGGTRSHPGGPVGPGCP